MKKKKEERGFLNNFSNLYEFTEKEFEKCPWINNLEVGDIINEIEKELEEVKAELKKGDDELVAKETADVFRDALLLLFVVSRKTGIKKDRMISYIVKKMKWRKPWVEGNKEVSLEEAIEIWEKKKYNEKLDL